MTPKKQAPASDLGGQKDSRLCPTKYTGSQASAKENPQAPHVEPRAALLDRLNLRGICGGTASLLATSAGWYYRDTGAGGSRVYNLTSEGGTRGVIVAWCGGYWVGWVDLLAAQYRREAAAAIAQGDENLERAVKLDLWRLAQAIRFACIDAELRSGLNDEPPGSALKRVGLTLLGLSRPARRAVERIAVVDGATMEEIA